MICKPLPASLIAALLFVMTSPVSADQHENAAAHSKTQAEHVDVPDHGVAVLYPTAGNDVRGVVILQQQGDDVQMAAKIIGLSPGEHGFHIHQFGDLRASDGTSAGGHYDPAGNPHGGPDDAKHHAGDFGNVTANQEGVAEFKLTATNQKVHLLLGRAFVVHGGADDLESQPSGDAGPRVAVGVIGIANPDAK